MEEDYTALPAPNETHLEDEVTTGLPACKVRRLEPGGSIFLVTPSQAPNNCRRMINFVFVVGKDSDEYNMREAVRNNNKRNMPFTLYGRYFLLRELVSPLVARNMKEALGSADLFVCSFIFRAIRGETSSLKR